MQIDNFQLHPSLMEAALPKTLNLEVTNHCNLRCTHCGHYQYPKFEKGNISLEFFEEIKPLLGKGKIENLNLSDYGESFLSPRWKAVFNQAKDIPDITLSFITNGVLLHKFWDLFKHPGLEFNVSFDGASEETYGHFRGKGYFDKTIANLRELKAREERGEAKPSNRGFIVVLSQINVHEMPRIVELAHELGFSNIIFTFQVFFDEETFQKESLFFAKERYDNNLELAISKAQELNITLIYADSFNGKYRLDSEIKKNWLYKDSQNRVRCGASDTLSYVKFHGQIEACCLPDRLPLGSLQHDGFLNVWYGSYYRRLRLSFIQDKWLPSCENCNFLQSIDVQNKQSHRLQITRDKGQHIDMPQPYDISESNKQYQNALEQLKSLVEGKTNDEAEAKRLNPYADSLSVFLHLSRIEPLFYEVENAIGVIWCLLGDRQKAEKFFKRALEINPDDSRIKENLNKLAESI